MENKANLLINLPIFSFNIPSQTQLQLHDGGGCVESEGEAVRLHDFC